MHFSQYLENAVFYEQSPATAQLFEEKADKLFEKSSEQSCVEIHIQPPFQTQSTHDLPDSPISLESTYVHVGLDVRTECPTPLGSTFDCGKDPPRYVGSRGSRISHVKDTTLLAHIAAVSCFTLSNPDLTLAQGSGYIFQSLVRIGLGVHLMAATGLHLDRLTVL